jgi:DNA-binding NtrC family response regulator
VRLIAATNRNLRQLVDEGAFREDLFFRLNVVSIHMPTLRERPEDIILMANVFLKEFAEENQRPLKPLTDQAIHRLVSYPWPGNVRELRTAIEHGVVMSNDDVIDVRHLPAFLGESRLMPQTASAPAKNALAAPVEFNLHSLESSAIRRALAETGDNRTQAAELLGISRRTLQRKIKELGL